MGINLTDEQLRSVAVLSKRLSMADMRVTQLEAQLKEEKAVLRHIEEQELPDLLSELGLEALTLKDGSSVAVKPFISASITKANEEAAHDWLREHGFSDLIKERTVTNVHSQTLKAFVRERIEAGDELPEDLFSIYVGRKAYVK